MKQFSLNSVLFNLVYLSLTVFALIPRPKSWNQQHESLCELLNPINYNHAYANCPILENALRKFTERISNESYPTSNHCLCTDCVIHNLTINIIANCDESSQQLWPNELMNESYSITIVNNQISIEAQEIWGVLYALETLAQLVYRHSEHKNVIFKAQISDQPLFVHRGYLIDTSRHYLSLNEIKKFLDAMAMTKMNVLHWHITDDQSFPFVSEVYPSLSEKGAFHPKFNVYTPEDVKDLLNYARIRGIRILTEFDTPGHTLSWGKGNPDLLAKCSNVQISGPINPILNSTYTFLEKLFTEIVNVFPESMIHLGGDEVDYTCWSSNAEIVQFMNKSNFGNDFKKLEGYYMERLIELLQKLPTKERKLTPIVWQEIFENGFRGDNSTVIHVWKQETWQSVMNMSTSSGYRVLLSACWYLNIINYGDDWKLYYQCNPIEFGGTNEQIKLVIGGEATMWGEYVDDTNLFSRSWPRGAAVAERLWSVGKFLSTEFSPRLDELRCRMLRRGWNAEPVTGPGYCPY